MKIANVEIIPITIPFGHGGKTSGPGLSLKSWSSLNTMLVRIETDNGIVGWGEAFCYNSRRAIQGVLEEMIVPVLIGRDASDIAALMHQLQKDLHLFGRYGMIIHALSGIDTALWDLAGKAAGLPVCNLLGGSVKTDMEGYSSLFKYDDPELVAEKVRSSLNEGYEVIKLHETGVEQIAAARKEAGEGIPITVDTNCPWTPIEAYENAMKFKPYDIHWLEEPIFPPEDFQALAKLQSDTGIAIASGENACTAFQFREMFEAGAVTYAQPSVTKVGGITECRKVSTLAEAYGVQIMPHSPYFGPGFLATLHLTAAEPNPGLIEWLYLDREACLYGDVINPKNGKFAVPDMPGLGPDPDADVIKDYRVKDD
ncbi:MAG: hypothetical protein COB78_01340 [Hyphomicrobiales bacterium]|nr:MAG: hypothetical protein COB78_01340 [Hyphomicrobiales bacterium]